MIPCQDCLLVPICRHKQYPELLDSCVLIRDYILYGVPGSIPLHRHRVIELLFTLKSQRWSIKRMHKDTGFTLCGGNDYRFVERDEHIGIKELKCLRGW